MVGSPIVVSVIGVVVVVGAIDVSMDMNYDNYAIVLF